MNEDVLYLLLRMVICQCHVSFQLVTFSESHKRTHQFEGAEVIRDYQSESRVIQLKQHGTRILIRGPFRVPGCLLFLQRGFRFLYLQRYADRFFTHWEKTNQITQPPTHK